MKRPRRGLMMCRQHWADQQVLAEIIEGMATRKELDARTKELDARLTR